jgi:hypothetical protein
MHLRNSPPPSSSSPFPPTHRPLLLLRSAKHRRSTKSSPRAPTARPFALAPPGSASQDARSDSLLRGVRLFHGARDRLRGGRATFPRSRSRSFLVGGVGGDDGFEWERRSTMRRRRRLRRLRSAAGHLPRVRPPDSRVSRAHFRLRQHALRFTPHVLRRRQQRGGGGGSAQRSAGSMRRRRRSHGAAAQRRGGRDRTCPGGQEADVARAIGARRERSLVRCIIGLAALRRARPSTGSPRETRDR